MLSDRQCETCGEWFAARQRWHRQCVSCYYGSSWEGSTYRPDYGDTQQVVDSLRRRCEMYESQISSMTVTISSLHVEVIGLRHQLAAKQTTTTTIPDRRLTALIQLYHPDKHGGSRAATEATAWLLSLRKRRGATS